MNTPEKIPLRTLIVEDNQDDALLLVDSLESGGYAVEWLRVDSETGLRHAMAQNWDIVLSDYSMPGFSGTHALQIYRTQESDAPFIFVSGTIGEDAAVAAIKAGAQDYVMKGNTKRLLPTVARELRDAQLKKERRQTNLMLQKMSQAINQTTDSVFITDREGYIEYVNPAFEKLTGYSLDEVRGKKPDYFYAHKNSASQTDGDSAAIPKFWLTVQAPENYSTFSNRKKDGSIYFEERVITAVKDDNGQITHYVSTSRDITSKLIAEEGRRRLAEVLEATPDIVCVIHPTGKVWYLNNAGYRALGLDPAVPVKGRNLSELFPPAFQRLLKTVFSELLKTGIWMGETTLPTTRHAEQPYSLVILAHQQQDGRIKHLSIIARDIAERKKLETQLQHQATHDGLTKLPNRFLLLDRFKSALRHARRNNTHVAVLFIDLDNFKRINDSLGHTAGDYFLERVAQRLSQCLRAYDTVARHGGDEFTILLTGIEHPENVMAVIHKLQEAFLRPIALGADEVYATFSIGVSIFPSDGKEAEQLLRNADTAMYQAKKAGSNQYCFYAPEMNARSHEILTLESELRGALENREFHLYYQPQMDIIHGTIIGLEGLIRWQHGTRGVLPPGDFIGLLENSGLIIPVGEWIIREACRQQRQLDSQGYGKVRISVNVSAPQFCDRHFLQKVQDILADEAMAAEKLELEITENIIMQDPDAAVSTLKQLRDRGIRIAIDDFGTGYSSLSYLKKFPINVLKIDQTFVHDLNRNQGDSAIIEASVTLARKLNLEIVAEGVETQDQLNFLRDCHCGIAQGYYLSRPMPAKHLPDWLAQRA